MTRPSARFLSLPLLLCLTAGGPAQESRPAGRPAADDVRARAIRPDWPDGAPGRVAVPFKMLPITRAPYSSPGSMKHRIDKDSLVIGIEQGGKARAYPINMLGGPAREIINDVLTDEPFVVNW